MTTQYSDDDILPVIDSEREFYTKLGHTIRHARMLRNMSIAQLADIAGATVDQMEKYESATLAIPVFHLMPIIRYMDYPPEFDTLQ